MAPSPDDALRSFWIPSQRERFPIARHEIEFQILVGKIPKLEKEKFPILPGTFSNPSSRVWTPSGNDSGGEIGRIGSTFLTGPSLRWITYHLKFRRKPVFLGSCQRMRRRAAPLPNFPTGSMNWRTPWKSISGEPYCDAPSMATTVAEDTYPGSIEKRPDVRT
jgi:hypothetical protein